MFSSNTSSGLRPDAGVFLLFGQEKDTKEKAAPVSRATRVPCAACLTSAAVELAQSEPQAPRTELKQSSPKSPRPSELLGATQGPQLRKPAVQCAALIAPKFVMRHGVDSHRVFGHELMR